MTETGLKGTSKFRSPGERFFVVLVLCCMRTVAATAEPPVTATAFTPDGAHILVGSQGGIEILSWPQLNKMASLSTDMPNVHDLKFSPTGQTLLVGGGSPGEDGSVEIYSWPERQRVDRIAAHDDVVYRVAWSPDGTHWVTASADATCRCFDAATSNSESRYDQHSGAVLSICFLSEANTVASAGIDHTIRIWSTESGKHLRTLDNHVHSVNHVAMEPKRELNQALRAAQMPTLVATVSEDRTVRIWQPTIGRLVRFARLPSSPRTFAWSPEGDRLIVACNDGQLRVIDAETLTRK